MRRNESLVKAMEELDEEASWARVRSEKELTRYNLSYRGGSRRGGKPNLCESEQFYKKLCQMRRKQIVVWRKQGSLLKLC